MKLIIAIALACSVLTADAALVNRTTYNAGTNALASQIAAKQGIIWTNSAGIVTPAGGQSATNRLQFVSGAADNATNEARVVGSAVPWIANDEAKLDSWKNAETNVAYMTPWGGLRLGRGAAGFWSPYQGDILTAIHDTSVGDPEQSQMVVGGGDTVAGTAFTFRFDAQPNNDKSVTQIKADDGSDPSVFTIEAVSDGADGGSFLDWSFADADVATPFNISPLNTGGGNYVFGSGYPVTSGDIVRVRNSSTNVLAVGFDGQLTSKQVSAEPDAPDAGYFTLFGIDNGAGKMILKVRFPTGASQTVATEP